MSRALGRYELVRPLARGGMGEVYLARRRTAGVEKWLVVKRMRPERAGDTRFLDLFMREARLSMSLAHQNIVPVFDFGRIDDQVFLAMERVEGKDLGSSLAQAGKPLPPLLAAFIAAECCQALDYAHRRKGPDGADLGIVHRDVTPRNVLLSWSGEVKLTDFGIAALAGDEPSKMAGTPAYMAPEQARGEALDLRADVYAVGMVLREAFTGVRGRRGNDRETVLELAKQGALDSWPDGVDSTLRAIIDKATALDRAERYPDARSMLEELDAFMVAERSGKKSDSPARQLAAWLTELWKDAREDETLDANIEGNHLVSFLDDGALDILGTGTQRSLMATAADVGPTPEPKERATSQTEVSVDRPPSQTDPSAAPIKPPRTKTIALVVGVGAVAATLAVVFAMKGDDTPAPQPEPERVGAVVPDASPALRSAVTPDAELAPTVEVTPDAGTPLKLPKQPKPPRAGSGSAGSAVEVAPAITKRKVTINSIPWSNWTIDGAGAYQGLATIELAPGPHKIRFTGNPHFPADKTITIDVPDKDGFKHMEKLQAAP